MSRRWAMRPGWVLVVLALQPLLCAAKAPDTAAFRWSEEKERSLALMTGELIVWRFNFGAEQPKPNFYPLAVAGSPSLVIDRPADHPWHHGLWLSWKFINDVNFWEPDPKTGMPPGRTSWKDVKLTTQADFSATIALGLTYAVTGEEPVLREDRVMRISPPDDTGKYAIDWQSTFHAGEKGVKLSCVPIPPAAGGVAWGGYAGLSVRFAPELAAREACSSEGPVTFVNGIYRGQSNTMDYSGLIGDHAAGIAVLAHPKNPRHPADWYVIRSEMSYVNASLLSTQPLFLNAGEVFTLRYRVIVHPERWEATRLQSEHDQFSKP